MSNAEDRKAARGSRGAARKAAYLDDANRPESSGSAFGGSRFLVGEEELAQLGIKPFIPSAEDDGSPRNFAINLLDMNRDDGDKIGGYLPLYGHEYMGPDDDSFLCPREMRKVCVRYGLPIPEAWQDGYCPICARHGELLTQYKADKDSLSEEDRKARYKEVSRLHPFSGGFTDPKPKKVVLFLEDDYDQAAGVHVWLAPATKCFEEGIKPLASDPRDPAAFIDLWEPEEDGQTVFFTRKGKQFATEYYGFQSRTRKDPIPQDVCDRVPRIMDILNVASVEDMERVVGQLNTAPSQPEPERQPARTERQSRGRTERPARETPPRGADTYYDNDPSKPVDENTPVDPEVTKEQIEAQRDAIQARKRQRDETQATPTPREQQAPRDEDPQPRRRRTRDVETNPMVDDDGEGIPF